MDIVNNEILWKVIPKIYVLKQTKNLIKQHKLKKPWDYE